MATKYLLVGEYRWGKGTTERAALKELNANGGRKHTLAQCAAWEYDGDLGDVYVSDMGGIVTIPNDGDPESPFHDSLRKIRTGSLFKKAGA